MRHEVERKGRKLAEATVRPPWKRPSSRTVDLQERAVMGRATGIVKDRVERTAPSRAPDRGLAEFALGVSNRHILTRKRNPPAATTPRRAKR